MHRPGFWRMPDKSNRKTSTASTMPKKKVHFKDDYYVSRKLTADKASLWTLTGGFSQKLF